MYYSGLLTLDYEEITSDQIDMIFDNYRDVYGENMIGQVLIKSVQNSPSIYIKPKQTVINSTIDIILKNPYNKEYDSAIIYANLTLNLTLKVHDKFILTGNIDQLDLNVFNFITYFKSD